MICDDCGSKFSESKLIYNEDYDVMLCFTCDKKPHNDDMFWWQKELVEKVCALCRCEVMMEEHHDKCENCMRRLERGEQW